MKSGKKILLKCYNTHHMSKYRHKSALLISRTFFSSTLLSLLIYHSFHHQVLQKYSFPKQNMMCSKLFVTSVSLLFLGVFLQHSFSTSSSNLKPIHDPSVPLTCPSTNELYLEQLSNTRSGRAMLNRRIRFRSKKKKRKRDPPPPPQKLILKSIAFHIPAYCVYYELDHQNDHLTNRENINENITPGPFDLRLVADWGRGSEKLGASREKSVVMIDLEGCEFRNHTIIKCFPVSRTLADPPANQISEYTYDLLKGDNDKAIWIDFEPALDTFILDLTEVGNGGEEWKSRHMAGVSYEPFQSQNMTLEKISVALNNSEHVSFGALQRTNITNPSYGHMARVKCKSC